MYGTLKSKSCPRCRGYIVIDRDVDGWYEMCLQCGYLRDLKSIVKARRRAKVEEGVAGDV